ncbi:hypothetical protein PI126_g3095 [Phytophthora idaei]|nr:hypothetical protein PI126_g3095 [Phytophthora idaei]
MKVNCLESATAALEQSPPQNPYTFTREDYDSLVASTPNCQISKRSKYEEIDLVHDCTLFDIYRQPRAPVTDPNATKTLSVRQLNDAFKCPICQGIIKETMVVMDCLHRFCGECISIAIRQSKRECPCMHIPSKRSLRPDTNFDARIRMIYPNLAEFERNEDQITEQLNQARHFNNASLSNTESPPVEKKRSTPDGSPSDTAPSSAAASKSAETVASRVDFCVLLHEEEQPKAPNLERTLLPRRPS